MSDTTPTLTELLIDGQPVFAASRAGAHLHDLTTSAQVVLGYPVEPRRGHILGGWYYRQIAGRLHRIAVSDLTQIEEVPQ